MISCVLFLLSLCYQQHPETDDRTGTKDSPESNVGIVTGFGSGIDRLKTNQKRLIPSLQHVIGNGIAVGRIDLPVSVAQEDTVNVVAVRRIQAKGKRVTFAQCENFSVIDIAAIDLNRTAAGIADGESDRPLNGFPVRIDDDILGLHRKN